MAERQLRSRSVATGVEAAPRDGTELDCNVVGSEALGNKESRSSSYTLAICKGMMEVKFSVCTP